MMKSGRITSCCVALLLVLTSVSAVQRLNSINDLKRIDFGSSVPKHTLVLLYWFANAVEIDNTGNIRLNFDPSNRGYGAHYYSNYERLLGPPSWGYQYYSIGSLNQGTSMRLPHYVVRPPVVEYEGGNVDRIIISARGQRIDRVYITQHYGTSEYDPGHTYEITTNLLRQIREFSVGENQQQLQHLRSRYGSNANVFDIRNTWGNLAGLGLLLFIVIKDKYSYNQPTFQQQSRLISWEGASSHSTSGSPNNSDRYDNQPSYNLQSRQSHWGETSSHNTSRSQNNFEWCFWCLVCCLICFCFVLLFIGLHYDKMR